MHCSFEEPPTQLQPGVCMYVLFWAPRPGGPAVIFNQDTLRTPGIGSLENITRGLCPLPPTHTPVTSLMVCTCCPSSLSLATPDPTRTWQTSPGTRTLYPSKLTMHGGPRARHPRLTTPTQLTGQRLWLPTLSW